VGLVCPAELFALTRPAEVSRIFFSIFVNNSRARQILCAFMFITGSVFFGYIMAQVSHSRGIVQAQSRMRGREPDNSSSRCEHGQRRNPALQPRESRTTVSCIAGRPVMVSMLGTVIFVGPPLNIPPRAPAIIPFLLGFHLLSPFYSRVVRTQPYLWLLFPASFPPFTPPSRDCSSTKCSSR
jgi:hypothetical protein